MMTISSINLAHEVRRMQATAQLHLPGRYRNVTEEKLIGATYTPLLLADFVAENIISSAHLDETETIRVLDPAIGDGDLLLSLLGKLIPRTKARIHVHGFETNKAALTRARQRLASNFSEIEVQLVQQSFLDFVLEQGGFAHRSSLFSLPDSSRFDLIIANPPYVRTQVMGADQAQALASLFGLSGRVDLYHAFLVAMSHMLQPHGTAGIIVSNRFMTTRGGASVRAALRERLSLRHIWDLGDTKIFDAAVLPAIILAQGRNDCAARRPAFTSIYETIADAAIEAADPIAALSQTGIVSIKDGRRFHVRHGELEDSPSPHDVWRIATDSGDAWLATVNKHTWDTFRRLGKVRVGVKTCGDRIFIRDDWNAFPQNQRPELLRPVTTHHIAGRFRSIASEAQRLILYPHQTVQGGRRTIDLDLYPKSRAYLETHRRELEKRTYLIEAGRLWYELWVPQNPAMWAAPKLVFKDISERPTFWLDLNGSIVNGDCYWLTCDSPAHVDVLWLAAAVANSTFAEAFYDHRFHNKLYSGRRRFITQYVEQFPLPDPTSDLASEIIAGAKAIYAAPDSQEAAAIEVMLNQLVWRAFGLPLEEVSR